MPCNGMRERNFRFAFEPGKVLMVRIGNCAGVCTVMDLAKAVVRVCAWSGKGQAVGAGGSTGGWGKGVLAPGGRECDRGSRRRGSSGARTRAQQPHTAAQRASSWPGQCAGTRQHVKQSRASSVDIQRRRHLLSQHRTPWRWPLFNTDKPQHHRRDGYSSDRFILVGVGVGGSEGPEMTK